ncbi:maf protein [Chloroherpeton thalassium ATCC 35110]|uniref:dTTP/UTP pyrophosphatase n=1 Tax=Chloroherpeton thalassium (strain ATCC 35110 / GB-78) TaxID=517418 RepID=B3QUD9_CHLT3|nr:Maf family protein [Chloroherpeton thalassium]ACF14388.1 maf protein [Chloroherpeton thalassium ATCC 35110]
MISHIILASKSPRRRELLALLNIPFDVLTADTDEQTALKNPADIVAELAKRKADTIFQKYPAETENELVLSADTIVVLGETILNKPASHDDAVRMLSLLQGQTHHVFTGFSLKKADKQITDFEVTEVTFSPMSAEEIQTYIEVAKPFDKAGAYGIQDDFGACFIEKINGCYYNVVGLPVSKLYKTLKLFQD